MKKDIYTAALDWYYDHASEYDHDELESATPVAFCIDAMDEEGYDLGEPGSWEAVNEAYDDFLADPERPTYAKNLK
jgi:hypothetical protein